jgi:hypothetical protein
MKPRGIPELPQQVTKTITDKNGTVHTISVLTPQHQQFFSDVREQLLQLRGNTAIPDPITNLKATGQAFSNLVQFTKSGNADYYEVLRSPTPSLLDPHVQISGIGNSASWVDHVGNSGITVWYWVRARKNTGATGQEVGPVNATTLPAATGVTPPMPPPAGNPQVTDTATGRTIPSSLSEIGTRGSNHT